MVGQPSLSDGATTSRSLEFASTPCDIAQGAHVRGCLCKNKVQGSPEFFGKQPKLGGVNVFDAFLSISKEGTDNRSYHLMLHRCQRLKTSSLPALIDPRIPISIRFPAVGRGGVRSGKPTAQSARIMFQTTTIIVIAAEARKIHKPGHSSFKIKVKCSNLLTPR
jgi:hypothetical protein